MNSILLWVKKYKVLSAAIAVAILLIMGSLLYRATQGTQTTLTSSPIQRGAMIESVYGIGTVTAKNSFDLKLGVTSTVQKLFVKEGDQVKKGDPLLELDDAGIFRAPFEGTVTFLPVKVDETVFAQAVILSLVDLLDRYLLVSLEQRGAIRVRNGQKAKISFDAMRDQSFEGSVESVYSHHNSFLVRIGTSNLPKQILPGMTADVAIGIRTHENVLLVPTAAIQLGKIEVKRNGSTVVVDDVKIIASDGAMTAVESSNLLEGDIALIQKKVSP